MSGQGIDTRGMFVTVSAVPNESTKKGQWYTDAKPKSTHRQHGGKRQGGRTAVPPNKQINDDLNSKGKSVPFFLEDEKQYNLFLNQNSKLGTIIKKELGCTDFELFPYLRKAKDGF